MRGGRPRRLTPIPKGLRIAGLALEDGAVVVSFEALPPGPPPPPSPPERQFPFVLEGRRGNLLKVSTSSPGILVGAEARFLDEQGEVRGVGYVYRFDEDRVTLRIPYGGESGQRGVIIDRLAERRGLLFPPRPRGSWQAQAGTAFVLGGNNSNRVPGSEDAMGAVLFEASLHRSFARIPLRLGLEAGPVLLADDPRAQSGIFGAGHAEFIIELALRHFGLGIGAGIQSWNRDVGRENRAPTLLTRLRIGSLDGLLFEATPVVAFPLGAPQGFVGRVSGRFQIPVGPRLFVGGEAGGGRVGYVIGAAHLRWLMSGGGQPFSWSLLLRGGGTEIRLDPIGREQIVRGLGGLVGVGVDLRL